MILLESNGKSDITSPRASLRIDENQAAMMGQNLILQGSLQIQCFHAGKPWVANYSGRLNTSHSEIMNDLSVRE
jgi:hypothetical protein